MLICYSFPPHPGIGGRRWTKFTKFLSVNDIRIDVFNAENLSSSVSVWEKDVVKASVKVHSHRFLFQRILNHPRNWLEKVQRKLILFMSKFGKANPLLLTSFRNIAFWKKVNDHLRAGGIKKLIVSGDPFLFYQATLLKEKMELEVILDYRDLWNDHSFYGINVPFTSKQKKFFEYAENYAINHCDKLIFVDEEISKPVLKRCANKIPLYTVLHNGYDRSDFAGLPSGKKISADKLSIFFGGNISSDLNKYFLDFFSSLCELRKKAEKTLENFSFTFCGNFDDMLVDFCQNQKLNVTFRRDYLPVHEYLDLLDQHHIGIIHLSPEYKGSFATKFSDLIQLDIFTLLIGEKGGFAEQIEALGIGLHFDPKIKENFFTDLIAAYRNRKIIPAALKEEFDMELISKQLYHFLQTPVQVKKETPLTELK